MSKQYGLILKREAKLQIDKALEEDPSIFEYDEVYDQMKKDRNVGSKEATKNVERKSKFIESLKLNADQRKIAEERRLDRKIEKEREAEGDLFKDKDVFVTDAYKQKLMERKIYEERERKEIELEGKIDLKFVLVKVLTS